MAENPGEPGKVGGSGGMYVQAGIPINKSQVTERTPSTESSRGQETTWEYNKGLEYYSMQLVSKFSVSATECKLSSIKNFNEKN